jgi:hypothetical protein
VRQEIEVRVNGASLVRDAALYGNRLVESPGVPSAMRKSVGSSASERVYALPLVL